jgi:putative membrane protein
MIKDRPSLRPFELDPRAGATVVEEIPPDRALAEAESEAEPEEVRALETPRRRWPSRLLGLFTLGVTGAVVVQALDYVHTLFVTDPLLGVPFAVFLALVLVSGGLFAAGELRDLRRLQHRAVTRATAERLAASELHEGAPALLAPLEREFGERQVLKANVAAFRSHRNDALNDGELLRLFERQVLAPVDRAAYRLVLQSSRDVGLLTALSPLGLLDGILVLWRTTVLFRSVARLYGMAPGPTMTLALLKRSVRNAAVAGLADVVTHAAVEHVGAGLLAMLSARAGQGAGNALLHARLGIEAIRQCRPLPFMAEEPPRLSSVRKALFDDAGKLKQQQP